MANPVWDGIEIDFDALDGYGWRVTKISIDSVDYPLFLGYQVAALREMDGRISAIGSDALVSMSSSSLTIGAGAKSLAVEPGKGFGAGALVTVADSGAASSRWEIGRVTTYDVGTGALQYTVGAESFSGAGTGTSWTVTIAGEAGPVGPGDVNGPVSSTPDAWVRFGGADGTEIVDGKWTEAPDGDVLAGGNLDLSDNTLSRARLVGTRMPIGDLGDVTGYQQIDTDSPNALTATLTGDTSFDFVSLGEGFEYTRRIRLVQGGAGGFLPTWLVDGAAANVKSRTTAPDYAALAPGAEIWITAEVWGSDLHVWEEEGA